MEKEAFAIGWMENDDTRNLKSLLLTFFIRKCTKLTGIFYLPSKGGCHIVDFLCKLLRIYGNKNMFFFKATIKCKHTEYHG